MDGRAHGGMVGTESYVEQVSWKPGESRCKADDQQLEEVVTAERRLA